MRSVKYLLAVGLCLVLLVNVSDACNRCRVKACGGCYATPVAAAVNYGYDIVHRPDGTYWQQGVQVERLQVFRYGKWTWGWFPVKSAVAQQYVSANEQGSTVTGYSTRTENYAQPSVSVFSKAYQGDPDLSLHLSGRLGDGALALAQEANVGIRAQGEQRTRVAEIQATGQVIAQSISALNRGPSNVSTRTEWRATSLPGGGFQVQPGPSQGGDIQASGQSNLTAAGILEKHRCLECHSGPKSKGGLDLSNDLSQLAPPERMRRLIFDEADKPRMPIDNDGHSVGQLTDEEIGVLTVEALK